MNPDVPTPRRARRRTQGHDMILMAVDPTVRNQTHQMQSHSRLGRQRHGLDQDRIASQLAVSDRFVNPRQILIHNSARSQIQVTDFAVAHLPRRQADILATTTDPRPWPRRVQMIMKWRARQQCGIAMRLRLIATTGVDAPSIANDQDDRSLCAL